MRRPTKNDSFTRSPMNTSPLKLGLIFFASIIYLSGCTTGASSEDERPNIIFIFTDDHASHAIGAYGGPLAALDPTPNMDRLAREGMLFRNAFVTNSICAPSRAVILTGLHSHLNSVPTNRERFDSTQTTFPKLLQQAGYETAMIGKWHLKSEPTGFDHWEVLPGPHMVRRHYGVRNDRYKLIHYYNYRRMGAFRSGNRPGRAAQCLR